MKLSLILCDCPLFRSSSAAPSSTRPSCCTPIVATQGGRFASPCPTPSSSTSCSMTSTRSPTRRSRPLPRPMLCWRRTTTMAAPRTSTRPLSWTRSRSRRPCRPSVSYHPPNCITTHHRPSKTHTHTKTHTHIPSILVQSEAPMF